MPAFADLSTLTLHRLPAQLSEQHDGRRVITIGNFDGVHYGHQALIQQTRRIASKIDAEPAVMLFEPQPMEFFGAEPPVRLMRLAEKIRTMANFGIRTFLIQPFSHDFAQLTPAAFAERLAKLGAQAIVIGDDFHYGARAAGDVATLAASGHQLGFQVWQSKPILVDGERVSSSRIREALAQHQIAEAVKLLGHPLRFWGRVGHGDQLGRQLGFPTANLVHKRRELPLRGVYSARVDLTREDALNNIREIPAVCNIGTRPTVNGLQARFEVHLFDVDSDLYGQTLCVTIHDFIRPEQKFDGLVALQQQIQADIQTAWQQLSAEYPRSLNG